MSRGCHSNRETAYREREEVDRPRLSRGAPLRLRQSIGGISHRDHKGRPTDRPVLTLSKEGHLGREQMGGKEEEKVQTAERAERFVAG